MPEKSAAPAKGTRKALLLREPPPPGGGEIMTYDKANARYSGEWLIMRVTAYEADSGWPAEGYVVAHDPSEDGCWDMYNAAIAAGEPREAAIHICVAGRKLRTGAEMLAAIAAKEDELDTEASPSAREQQSA